MCNKYSCCLLTGVVFNKVVIDSVMTSPSLITKDSVSQAFKKLHA